MVNLGLAYMLGFAVTVIPPVVGLIIVAIRGQGRAKSLGLIGFGLAAVFGVITQSVSFLMPRIMNTVGMASYGIFSSLWSIVVLLLNLVEMIILALAIVVTTRPVAQPPQAAAVPYGYNQPPTSG
ncbi:MAG: hypothetical protein J2P23_01380 [Microlunatus sp.]|nr:hypothetical protein [Microlunatus sp.]